MRLSWRWWLLLLWLAAVLLLTHNLGALPLRDWDEALVARVAEEISLRPFPSNLLPTLWGEPYANKPPLLHALIAAAIQLWRGGGAELGVRALPPEWLVRLLPALLSSLIVPLVAAVQWRLRPGDRLAALCSAAVALTLLPLMRHGRLAMLDGSLISAMTLLWWALLSLPRQPGLAQWRRWGLTAGAAASAILLLKAPAILPLLLGPLLLLAWERRWPLRCWRPLLGWMAVGLLPGVFWHSWHLWARGSEALVMWGHQGLARVVSPIEGHSAGWTVPLLEVLEGGWPWLALWPLAMLAAWQHRRSRWGFWSLGLTAITAAVVLPLQTQLPWYSHLLWPSFALSVGPLLAQLIRPQPDQAVPAAWRWLLRWLPGFWCTVGAAMLALQWQLPLLLPVILPAGLALLLGGALLLQRQQRWRQRGVALLVALLWLALFHLFSSGLWLWELAENWPVPPLVASVQPALQTASQAEVPDRDPSLLLLESERPSLNWYLGRDLSSGSRARRKLHHSHRPLLVLSHRAPSSTQLHCTLLQPGAAASAAIEAPDLYRCTPL